MLLQELAQGFAEDAHAAAVDDADARESGEEGAVDKFFDFAGGVVDGVADNVDLGGDVGAFAFIVSETEMPRARAACTGSFGSALALESGLRQCHRGRFSFSWRPSRTSK